MTRNIGLPVKNPKKKPEDGDNKNPFNGTLSIRGQIFEGKVIKSAAKDTVILEKESPIYFKKFKILSYEIFMCWIFVDFHVFQ